MEYFSTYIIYTDLCKLTKFHKDVQMVLDEDFGKQCVFTNRISAMSRFRKIKQSGEHKNNDGFIGIVEFSEKKFLKVVLNDIGEMTEEDDKQFDGDYDSGASSDEEVLPLGLVWELIEELEYSKKNKK